MGASEGSRRSVKIVEDGEIRSAVDWFRARKIPIQQR